MIRYSKKYINCNFNKDRIKNFIFTKNWIEPPLFHNNKGKVLRFDLESKSETDCARLIEEIFNDVFYESSPMLVLFYGYGAFGYGRRIIFNWRRGKRYFKKFSLKKLMKRNYTARDEDDNEIKPYLVACLTDRKCFKFKKYLADYMDDDFEIRMAFISLKKGTAIQLYDSRGFDVLSVDKDFLRFLYKKHERDIIEYNRSEIIESLK